MKYNIHVGAGIIDSDYRGNIKVLLTNHSNHAYAIITGEPIAQMIIQKYETVEFRFVSAVEFNNVSQRGQKGFGEMTETQYN